MTLIVVVVIMVVWEICDAIKHYADRKYGDD